MEQIRKDGLGGTVCVSRTAEKGRYDMSKVRIYGVSDDICEIEGSKYPEDEIGCFNCIVHIKLTSGAEIALSYGKLSPDNGEALAIWKIDIVKYGTGDFTISYCYDENAEINSDVFEIDAEIESIELTEI